MGKILNAVLDKEYKRIGLPNGITKENFLKTFKTLAKDTAQLESSGNTQALNVPLKGKKATSAKGLYQFTDDSFITGMNRLRRYGDVPDVDSVLKLSADQQTALFIANTAQQIGTDKNLIPLLKGIDVEANSRELYSKYHHTNPDEATLKRMNSFF